MIPYTLKFRACCIQIAALCAVVWAFNVHAIFGLDTLLQDDLARYSSLANGSYPTWMYKHSVIGTYIQHRLYELLVISPELARLTQLLLLQTPLCIAFFYLCRKTFRLPAIVSLAAAVLPNISPGQKLIPTFINGSYVVQGFLAATLALIIGDRFLTGPPRKRWGMLVTSMCLYALSLDIMEQAVFLLVPFVYFFCIRDSALRNKVAISASFALLACLKITWVRANPRSMHENPPFSPADIWERVSYFWSVMDPLFQQAKSVGQVPLYASLTVGAITFSLVYASVSKKRANGLGDTSQQSSGTPHFVCTFSLLLLLCSIFPFVFLSPHRVSRYAYIPSYGYILMFVVTIHTILLSLKIHPRAKYSLFCLCISVVAACSGVTRVKKLDSDYVIKNRYFAQIKAALSDYDFPSYSQIVIVDKQCPVRALESKGSWIWTSGYIQYLTGRNDLQGILPREINFYDPFSPTTRKSYSKQDQMTGLDLDDPIFLFRKSGERLEQLVYGLQWKTRGQKSSEWSIFEFNQSTGRAHTIATGTTQTGYTKEMLTLIQEKGIMEDDILWGQKD
jgi:hypothetical protein